MSVSNGMHVDEYVKWKGSKYCMAIMNMYCKVGSING